MRREISSEVSCHYCRGGSVVHTTGDIGLSKHRKKGRVPNASHFTGPKRGKPIRRKGKGLTYKQRQLKKGTHRNKYA